MANVLYRDGANNGRAPLNQGELNALCEDDIGTAIYLYNTGFSGPSTTKCSKGSLDYMYESWQGKAARQFTKRFTILLRTRVNPSSFIAGTAFMLPGQLRPQR